MLSISLVLDVGTLTGCHGEKALTVCTLLLLLASNFEELHIIHVSDWSICSWVLSASISELSQFWFSDQAWFPCYGHSILFHQSFSIFSTSDISASLIYHPQLTVTVNAIWVAVATACPCPVYTDGCFHHTNHSNMIVFRLCPSKAVPVAKNARHECQILYTYNLHSVSCRQGYSDGVKCLLLCKVVVVILNISVVLSWGLDGCMRVVWSWGLISYA